MIDYEELLDDGNEEFLSAALAASRERALDLSTVEIQTCSGDSVPGGVTRIRESGQNCGCINDRGELQLCSEHFSIALTLIGKDHITRIW